LTGFYEAVVASDEQLRTRLASAPDADAFVALTVEEAAKAGYEVSAEDVRGRLEDAGQRGRLVRWLRLEGVGKGRALPRWLRGT
jgi:hypothetical protein